MLIYSDPILFALILVFTLCVRACVRAVVRSPATNISSVPRKLSSVVLNESRTVAVICFSARVGDSEYATIIPE